MKTSKFFFGATSIVAMTAVLACSSSGGSSPNGSSGSSTNSGSSGGGSSAGVCKYEACSLLKASEVAQAMGYAFTTGTEQDVRAPTSTSQGEDITCDYTGSGVDAQADLSIACDITVPNDPTAVVQELFGDSGAAVSVSGLGDAAYWVEPFGSTGSLSGIFLLLVFAHQYVEISITIASPANGSFTVDPLTAAKQMATDALARL
jgi:hypothetical protein